MVNRSLGLIMDGFRGGAEETAATAFSFMH